MYLFREDFGVPTMCVLCLMPHVRARASGLHKAFTECAPPRRSFERERVTDGRERERACVDQSCAKERPSPQLKPVARTPFGRGRESAADWCCRPCPPCANAQPTRTPAVNPSAADSLRQIPSTARPSHWQRNGRRATHGLPSSMRSTAARSQYRRRHASRRQRRTPRRHRHLHRSMTRRLSSSS